MLIKSMSSRAWLRGCRSRGAEIAPEIPFRPVTFHLNVGYVSLGGGPSRLSCDSHQRPKNINRHFANVFSAPGFSPFGERF